MAEKTGRARALKETAMGAWRYRSRHLEGLINAIYHGGTNAHAEGINSRIQWIKYTARGFRNRERFRRAIHFRLESLGMAPESIKPIAFLTT